MDFLIEKLSYLLYLTIIREGLTQALHSTLHQLTDLLSLWIRATISIIILVICHIQWHLKRKNFNSLHAGKFFMIFFHLLIFEPWHVIFQQCGILTSRDSDEPVQPPVKLRNAKWCSVSSLTVVEYSSDLQRLWSDCAYAQAGLRHCWSHIPHCWKSHALAQIFQN